MWRKLLWLVPLVLAAVALLVLRRNPLEFLDTEFKAIDAAAKAKKYVVKQDADDARAHIELQFKNELAELDERQKTKAARLARHPDRLAKFLVRAGAKSRMRRRSL